MNTIILDRDGVINQESEAFIKSTDEWHPLPGSLKAIAKLNRAGYRVIVVSNQSGLARGKFNIEALNAIHQKMHTQLARLGGLIDAVFFCAHGPDDGCRCRKPEPGLYLDVMQRLGLIPDNILTVGDKLTDIQAGRAAGIGHNVLVRTGQGQKLLDNGQVPSGIPVYADLAAVVDALLQDGCV